MSLMGLVSRVTPVHTAVRNCHWAAAPAWQLSRRWRVSGPSSNVRNAARRDRTKKPRPARGRALSDWSSVLTVGPRYGYGHGPRPYVAPRYGYGYGPAVPSRRYYSGPRSAYAAALPPRPQIGAFREDAPLITVPELAAKALGSFLGKQLTARFGSSDAELTELIPSAARLALECIATATLSTITSNIRCL
jgi:hypothetical protein